MEGARNIMESRHRSCRAPGAPTRMSHVIRELLEAVALALLVFFVIQLSLQNFRVEGHSMHPTLDSGEYLIVNKLPYFRVDMARLSRLIPFWEVEEEQHRYLPLAHEPNRGDVIVFQAPNSPGRDFVKRVIGLPGERVRITGGEIYIDGEKLAQKYVSEPDLDDDVDCVPRTRGCVLGEDQYFVLGDNRDQSSDSRDWGPVELEEIVGRVWFVYWPPDNLPFLESLR